MKTVEITLYDFDELSEEVQQRVINKYRNEGDMDFWRDEYEKTLELFCDIFNIKVNEWAICYRKAILFDFNHDDDVRELSGVRAVKWFWNNGYQKCMKGKYYHKNRKHRHSKILLEADNCPLTGVCSDDYILEPLIEFMKKPDSSTVYEVLEKCLERWLNAMESDYEETQEDEYIIEQLEGFMFTISGEIH
jgi:hypothetical protein